MAAVIQGSVMWTSGSAWPALQCAPPRPRASDTDRRIPDAHSLAHLMCAPAIFLGDPPRSPSVHKPPSLCTDLTANSGKTRGEGMCFTFRRLPSPS